MIFNKKKLAACLGLAMGVTTMTASVSALEVAADGVGRLLMGPIFVAQANNGTRITVTNPDNVRAVKARMAFRSKDYSDEIFDFIIYLSPGDVFRGEIYGVTDANGNTEVRFRTTDDSVRQLPGTQASVNFSNEDGFATDFAVPLNTIEARGAGDTAETGHFEVISAYSAEGVVNLPSGGTVTITRGMSKVSLASVFDSALGDLLAANNCQTGADSNCATIKANVETTAELSGQAEIYVGENRAFYSLTALTASDEDNDGTIECNVSVGSLGDGYCEKVVGNSLFDFEVGNALVVGEVLLPGSGDNIVNIERALARAEYHGNYETNNDTSSSLIVTFPTRYRHEGNDVCLSRGDLSALAISTDFSSPFRTDRRVEYFVHQFNNSEDLVPSCSESTETNLISGDQDVTTSCPPAYITPEVEVISYDWTTQMDGTTAVGTGASGEGFESGKYQLALNAITTNTCANEYAGVPAIVSTLKQSASNGQIIGILKTN